jgi:hypothetical protein
MRQISAALVPKQANTFRISLLNMEFNLLARNLL